MWFHSHPLCFRGRNINEDVAIWYTNYTNQINQHDPSIMKNTSLEKHLFLHLVTVFLAATLLAFRNVDRFNGNIMICTHIRVTDDGELEFMMSLW